MVKANPGKREHWNTRLGLILAVAGSAIGLGNFLRFPVQATENGGGAFMIPYIFAFLFLGIPLMWVEWAMGRYGGSRGHGTTPAIFAIFTRNSGLARMLGVFGLWLPLVVVIYYMYIESWTLGYSIHFLLGSIPGLPVGAHTPEEYLKPFKEFLTSYIGAGGNFFTQTFLLTYVFFIVTFLFNTIILYEGVSRGIEKFSKIAMPILFILALVLFFRVLILKTPSGSAVDGLNFLWKPNFNALMEPKVWIAAAGQIFFTMSVGFGMLVTYASYMNRKEDIVLTSLSSASLNNIVEVVLGGSIAIPAAVAFFGVAGAMAIAHGGAFHLGFVSMSAIFANMPAGNILGFLWFFLLFFAGLTSSVSLVQPVIAFLEDEFGFSRPKAVYTALGFIFLSAHIVIFIDKSVDEFDFWAGTLGIVFFGLVELVLFLWMFDSKMAWEEINRGGMVRVPRFYLYIMKYFTPCYLLLLLGSFAVYYMPSIIKEQSWKVWVSRIFLIALFALLAFMVHVSARRKAQGGS